MVRVLAPAEAREHELRRRLSIPADAERVLIFGETSHWDPNWLFTADRYYRLRIRRILERVFAELEREPRRVFALESLFFLRYYWERQPRRRATIRRLINEGRLRLTGTGMTTPDTLLPDAEAILRDYLLGQEWLRAEGMAVEPRLAYLPDDFGHSPALPALLRALGFTMAGITRIDGMHFVGSDYRPRAHFPLAGSSAERLLRDLGTLDFVWRARDGSEVLCHWNAFSYFQGDMLAHRGIIRWMGLTFGVPWRTERHVARRSAGFAADLAPLARTPYLFCPIGCDFNSPIRGLGALLDRHNRTRYPERGVYALTAGMEDYLELVACHRERLPVLELDPNPYWMGFYASRPEAKRRCRRITRKLTHAEALAAVAPDGAAAAQRDLASAWDLLVVSNHHDFITGTSPERVWRREQRPWLLEAERLAEQALARLRPPLPAAAAPAPPEWRLADGRLEVVTPAYRLTLAEEAGGCLVSLRDAADGAEVLAGPGNDLVAYRDSGGLWRLGHEYRGGSFRAVAAASRLPARIAAAERGGQLEVRVTSVLAGRPVVRRLFLRADTPLIRMQLAGAAARRVTVTCRFPTVLRARELTMDVPGGVVTRPRRKLFDPTFWPARSFVHVRDARTERGLAAFLGGPAAVTLGGRGGVEWVALRNAPRERAFGFLPVPAHPASGRDGGPQRLEYVLLCTLAGDYRDNRLPELARRALAPLPWGADAAAAAVTVSRPDVLVTALKRAHRGSGLIVRLESFARGAVEVRLRCGRPVRAARLCDARERDLAELCVEHGEVVVPVRSAVTSVRLLG